MRVAILHDHFSFVGGGERVVLTLASALSADVFATDVDPTVPARAGFPGVRVREVAKVPRTPLLRQSRQAAAFRRLRLSGYDVYVLSGNWAVAAARRHRPNLWYCHTPVRVFYDLRAPFLADLAPAKRVAARAWMRSARPKYETDVRAVERVVANSHNVADRLRRYLGRTAEVVYPPVDVSQYRFGGVGEAWLSVNRLSHEKRLRLQVEAFRRMPRQRLLVAGGPGVGVDPHRFVKDLGPLPNVEFLGEVADARLRDLYASCRGLVATAQDEDFGMTPLEAMASGKAVIAVDEGGYRETVLPGHTGWLVPATPEALVRAISTVTASELEGMRDACVARARAFDRSVFVRRMTALLEGALPPR